MRCWIVFLSFFVFSIWWMRNVRGWIDVARFEIEFYDQGGKLMFSRALFRKAESMLLGKIIYMLVCEIVYFTHLSHMHYFSY